MDIPIKEAIVKCRCKVCGKEFTMFDNGYGELIFFPDSSPVAAWGKFELVSHFKNKHRKESKVAEVFYPTTNEIVENMFVLKKGTV